MLVFDYFHWKVTLFWGFQYVLWQKILQTPIIFSVSVFFMFVCWDKATMQTWTAVKKHSTSLSIKKCECGCEQIWNASLFQRLYYVTFVTGHFFAVSLHLNILHVMMLLARLQKLPTKKIRFHERAPAESFIARDNVATFLSWCREFGLADTCLFETDDLGKICQERVYQKTTARGSAANSVDLQKNT